MKKLKTWQIILLVIFYPVGIVYLIVWLINKYRKPAQGAHSAGKRSIDSSKLTIIRDINTKVVGVTFGNEDGTSRQAIIRTLRPGDGIILRGTPTDEHPEAVSVYDEKMRQIGYLNRDLAIELESNYRDNFMQVTVNNVTGGGDKNYGCNLHIVIYKENKL